MSARRTAVEARALLRLLLESGTTTWPAYAKKRMVERNVTAVDAVNVLRGGVVQEPEFENGEWRYQVRTPQIVVVCAFEDEEGEDGAEQTTTIVVVTVWRENR